MNAGEKIRFFRLKKGYTQKQLSEKTGIAEPNIRKYELNKANPKIETLKKFASALDLDVIDLITDADNTVFVDEEHHVHCKTTVTDLEENALINFYRQLNVLGKEEALKRISELTFIPEYKCEITSGVRIEYKPNSIY